MFGGRFHARERLAGKKLTMNRMLKLFNISQDEADALFGAANVAAIIGGVLVVIGTAGIFWIGSIREHYADRRLQANELATATANREAAASKERNTALQIELEKERTERLKLEERLAPRRLRDAGREKFRNAIRPFARTKIKLGVPLNNAEGDALLNEIGQALLEAGWRGEDISGATELGVAYPDGVTVLISDKDRSSPPIFATTLAKTFGELGLAAAPPMALNENLAEGEVKIAMGFKPGRHGDV